MTSEGSARMVGEGVLDPQEGQTATHPALGRFLARPDSRERLLILQAPGGTGRHRFASGWLAAGGEVPGADGSSVSSRILDWEHAAGEHQAFSPDLPGRLPTVEKLHALGLLSRDGRGGWFMPALVRNLLQQVFRDQDPDRASALNVAAAQAEALQQARHYGL